MKEDTLYQLYVHIHCMPSSMCSKEYRITYCTGESAFL